MARRTLWLGTGAMLIVGTVCTLAIAVIVVDPNDYKPQITAAVQQATGRALALNGPLRISRSLWPTIEVTDVKLANLPGGTRPDMATAERIEAQIWLPALLWRRFEVSKLTLIGPNILFEEVAHQPNWEFTAEAGQVGSPSATPAAGVTLRLRNVHVQNGMVTFRLPARTKVVGIRSLDFQHPIDGGPLKVSSILVYGDNQPFSLVASAEPTAGVGDPWKTQLLFDAYDSTATGTGTMDLAGNYDLQLEGKAAALEKLNALLPEMELPALHQMSFTTHIINGPVRGDLPVFGQTHLHIGSADLGDRVPGLKLGAVDVSLPAAGALATVSGQGSLAEQPFLLSGTVGVPEHLDGPITVPVDVTARGQTGAASKASTTAQGSLALKGKLALNLGHFDGLDAAIAVRTPTLSMVRPMLSQTLPALTDVSLDTQLAVPADIGSLAFRGARLSAREGDLSGDMTVGLGSVIALDGQLRSSRLDTDALLAAFGLNWASHSAGNNTSSDASGSVFSSTPLPWAALRGPTVGIKAAIASMTFQQQDWRNVELALQLRAGVLKVDRLFLGLPGGPLTASLSADASTDNVLVKFGLHAPAVPLALIARYADLPGQVSGGMKLDADLLAAGRSPRDLAASLDGSFAATMMGGSLSNAALIKLASPSLKALGIEVPVQGETQIHCFGVIGSFKKGIGRFATIAFDTSHLELSGAGQIDLGTETVALKLHPLAQLSGSPVSVPVLVEGSFRDVQGRLDASGLDKLGLLIDAWFGGDRLQTCADAGLVPPHADGH